MAAVNVATLKEHAEELFAKAIAGEPTIIEQNGKRAVLVPCPEAAPDFELYPEVDALLRQRLNEPTREMTEADWEALREYARNR
jgi:antitoxin (DNA-binding transcriptional repressor) of toxin-antitoxin stability system